MYAAKSLFGVDLIRNSGRQGSMNIILPNYGSRIAELVLKKKPCGFAVKIGEGEFVLPELEVKGWYSNKERDGNFELLQLARTNFIRIPAVPSTFALWLIRKSTGEIVDFRSNMFSREGGFTQATEPGDEISALLKAGEGETVEFKQEAPPKAGEPFDARDIAKEFVAFANHEGGVVLLGVDDESVITGVSDIKKLRDWVANIAANNCRPAIQVQVERRKASGKDIALIRVPAGIPGVAYQRNDGKIYVRRCATSRLADTHEIQELTRAKSQQPNEFQFPWQ